MTTSEQFQEWAKLWIESQPLPADDLFGSDEEQPPQQPITESAAASAAIVLPPGADTNKLDDPNVTVPVPVAGTVKSVDQKVLFKHVMQNMPLRCVKQIYSGNVGTTRDPSCPMQKLATSSHCIRSAYSIQKLFITMADQALDHAQTTSTVSGIQIGVDGRIWFPAPKPQVMVSSEVSQDDAVSDKPNAAADDDLEDELAQLVAKRRRLDVAGTKPATKAAAAKAAAALKRPAAKRPAKAVENVEFESVKATCNKKQCVFEVCRRGPSHVTCLVAKCDGSPTAGAQMCQITDAEMAGLSGEHVHQVEMAGRILVCVAKRLAAEGALTYRTLRKQYVAEEIALVSATVGAGAEEAG